jgi:hypothetical protein
MFLVLCYPVLNSFRYTFKKGFNSHSGGVESKVGPLGMSATNRPIVLAPGDCENGEIGGIKIGGETEVLGENLPQHHSVHHKSHLTRPRLEPGPPQWEASD